MEEELDSLVELNNEKEKKGKIDTEYKVAPASIEGWFPQEFWLVMNQTWAGLGQLLNKKESWKAIAEFVDAAARDCWSGQWRAEDFRCRSKIMKSY